MPEKPPSASATNSRKRELRVGGNCRKRGAEVAQSLGHQRIIAPRPLDSERQGVISGRETSRTKTAGSPTWIRVTIHGAGRRSGSELAEIQFAAAGHHQGINTALCSALSAFLAVPVEPKCTNLD
jgi:hypothetical protein